MSLTLKAILIWFVIMVMAVLNGTFRQLILKRFLDEGAAHIISTLLLSAIFLIIAYFFVKGNITGHELTSFVMVGILWTAMTLAFEFLAGHYLFRNPWSKLLADYNLAKGRIWVMVPFLTLIAPMIFYKFLKK
jgi:hypothetical protein